MEGAQHRRHLIPLLIAVQVVCCVTVAVAPWSREAEESPPLVPVAEDSTRQLEALAAELRELSERLQVLESAPAREAIERGGSSAAVPAVEVPSGAVSLAAATGRRPLEARANDPIRWGELERFAGRWQGLGDEATTTKLALLGPSELIERFGPPSAVYNDSSATGWYYHSAEVNRRGQPLTTVEFLLGHAGVISVRRIAKEW
ncbi:MAG: hypothetical protein NXI31_03265 [bacterium]|nr:hypothetical protein [bacterium]